MAKKEEEATKKRLERLSQSIGSLEVEEEKMISHILFFWKYQKKQKA